RRNNGGHRGFWDPATEPEHEGGRVRLAGPSVLFPPLLPLRGSNPLKDQVLFSSVSVAVSGVDVDIATHIDVYDDGPDRRYAYLSYCFIGFVMHRDSLPSRTSMS
ncbi:hypothetical protein BHE74_00033074, partial [Ensete ventricosum]